MTQIKTPEPVLRYEMGMLTETIQHFYNEDREHLDQLLREFERARIECVEEARGIYDEFRAGLEEHMRWEEELLYPVFERLAGENECGMESMRCEHQAIREQLARLEWLLEGPDARLMLEEVVLRDLLTPHCAKEELVLYPMLDELLTHAERSALLEQVRARREARELAAAE